MDHRFACDWVDVVLGRRVLGRRQFGATGYQITYSLAFSGDAKTLAAGQNNKVKVWDLATRKVRTVFGGHRGQVYAVAVSPDGLTIASGSADKIIRLWDATAPPRPRQASCWKSLTARRRSGART